MRAAMLAAAAVAATGSVGAAQPAAPTGETAAAATPAARPAPAANRAITLGEAIALATEENLEVVVGREQVVQAQLRERKTRTYRLPSLGVKLNAFLWNDAIEFDLGGIPLPPGTDTTVRGQLTGSLEVTVAQPITAALVLGTLLRLEQAGIDAARARLDQARLDLAYRVTETYLQALQLDTLREIAAVSVAQLEANLGRARALRDGGILGDVDILRLEAQRDAVTQQVVEAEVGAETTRRALAVLLALPDGVVLSLAPVDLAPPATGWTEDEAVALALRQRPEARVASATARQATLGIEVARAAFLPSVAAIASYTHTEGQGTFAAADSAFLGVTVEWKAWDWGARRADVDAARSARRTAEAAAGKLADAIALDVRARWLAADAARRTLDVAESGLRAATEAERLQNARFAEGAATTTDVIDAVSEVARARSQSTIARFRYLASWMALVRAVGQLPDVPGGPR